ncbi:DUF4111 domain-containing protein [Acetivibrio thermocellus]|uniref:aminoglycoside adenylyltransferase domain-containing protein n=1 Tax=Acetivibrio thermocellus TaxID=1515 RepID=UPI0021AD9D48|nr:aminoglycoside adenylyltransferase domain-containing protein [Acetivibrio thermocellus]UWV47699.1 DUF4111 domain-containing protein [Acetivibrio thermocellus]
MDAYIKLLESFVERNKEILEDSLVGIYLHGSAAMGCFNPAKSDIDLLVVVSDGLSDKTRRRYMDMVLELNGEAPAKGLELSIVKSVVCNPFVYPTPYELHFSNCHLDWYRSNPDEYLEKMKGTDRDLAAHVTVILHRGKVLYGRPVNEVFSGVSRDYYFDSIWHDVKNAVEDITDNPVYVILNLCRVLAFAKDNLVLSKYEGGKWGLNNIPGKFHGLVSAALDEYRNGVVMAFSERQAKEYAGYMLDWIRNLRESNPFSD